MEGTTSTNQLILKDEVEVDRFRQHRVLRPERHDYAFWHRSSPLLVTLNGNFSAVLMNVPLKVDIYPGHRDPEEVVQFVLIDKRSPVDTGECSGPPSPVPTVRRRFLNW